MARAFLGRTALCAVLLMAGTALSACTSSRHGGTNPTGGPTCTPACTGFDMCCAASPANRCVNPENDPNNCGGCGNVCPSGLCRSGACTTSDGSVPPTGDGGVHPTGSCSPTCSSSQRCCGTTCVNRQAASGTNGRTDSSFMNCNGCGIACDSTTASACSTAVGSSGVQCVCGSVSACSSGQSCVQSGSTFRCTDLSTDPMNCGMVGHACADGETCTGGVCGCGGAACAAGQSCCGGTCIDTQSDPMNCGSCGTVCGASGTTCSAGACKCGSGPACPGPSGSSLGSLCCGDTCIPQSDTHCGSCTTACDTSSGESCAYGMGISGGMEVCCSMFSFPGIPAICFGGIGDGGLPGFGDGGLPGFGDGGLPGFGDGGLPGFGDGGLPGFGDGGLPFDASL